MKNNQTLTIRNVIDEISCCGNWSYDKFITEMNNIGMYIIVSKNMIEIRQLQKDSLAWIDDGEYNFYISKYPYSYGEGQWFGCTSHYKKANDVANYIRRLVGTGRIDKKA